ncbi:MAG: ABC-type lipopolysaccharide export system permease component LptF [Saliniramus fredricksonii]|uniref:ABC-type lipopolysaccharide export system permease component LptF n=1 Tax=Saliniramus fredricksonii TaxID=1653334 RepID=A0A0P7XSV0_9HYPH|nr:LPS export ABC transporter permease LptF [Saliniramus fredricksonii]KPQ10592.1 MAG: ABC-type lipopolysaccharide export system permease component LptF [Saliniramus fredricksonii]SCC79275.1 lipopolysaccharide export system permease protein [Saliniramus fredricksonii]
MPLVERYILKIAVTAFLVCLLGLTAVIWLTQALREVDLLTGQGQTLVVFLTFTLLSLPALVAIIAPVALFIAILYTLNKLNGDSELVVMNAAGMSFWRIMRPFGWLTGGVAAMVGVMAVVLVPASFNELRFLITQIRADFVANLVREGQFTEIDRGVTFSFRERSGEALMGIFLQDRRDERRTLVYIAEIGQIAQVDEESYLVLERGSVHTLTPGARDSSIVAFKRYAVDLSAFAPQGDLTFFKPRERSTGELLTIDDSDPVYAAFPGRFRSELHDRLSAWLYVLAMAAIAFAALGDARTTRQGRGLAIAAAIGGVVALRVAGFAATSAAARSDIAVVMVWAIPVLTLIGAFVIMNHGARLRRMLPAPKLPALPARLRSAPPGGVG